MKYEDILTSEHDLHYERIIKNTVSLSRIKECEFDKFPEELKKFIFHLSNQYQLVAYHEVSVWFGLSSQVIDGVIYSGAYDECLKAKRKRGLFNRLRYLFRFIGIWRTYDEDSVRIDLHDMKVYYDKGYKEIEQLK